MAKANTIIDQLAGYSDRGHGMIRGMNRYAAAEVPVRRYRGEELSEIVGMSQQTISAAIKDGRLPPQDVDPATNRRTGPSIGQILDIQEYFGTKRWRDDDEDPVVISFTNFKGGAWKTTSAWYAGSYFASRGYRVLFVDLDPQASLTQNFGIDPDIDTNHESSLGPYILEENGFPVELAGSAVRSTYSPLMDIIPATLQLAGVEYALSGAIARSSAEDDGVEDAMFQWFQRVKDSLSEVRNGYDIVILDGTPSLGLLPLNIIFASDAVITPVPTETVDFASTLAFVDLYRDNLETLANVFGDIDVPDIFFLPTRFSDVNATSASTLVLDAIHETFGEMTFRTAIRRHEAVVSNLSTLRRTVFDVNQSDNLVDRRARKKAIENFSEVYEEVLQRVVLPRWPSRSAELRTRGTY